MEIDDEVAPLLRNIKDQSLVAEFMAKQDEMTQSFKKRKKPKQNAKLISLRVPEAVVSGQVCQVTVRHRLPASLGEQKLHVTLQRAPTAGQKNSVRIARQIVTISGEGRTQIAFEVPESSDKTGFRVAAFVGEDFSTNLQHIHSSVINLSELVGKLKSISTFNTPPI